MRGRVFRFTEGVLGMIEANDTFNQLVKVCRSRKHGQSCLNCGFKLQSEVSHTRIKGISEDLAEGGEFSSEGGC